MKIADEEPSCSGETVTNNSEETGNLLLECEYGSSSTSGVSDAGRFVEEVMPNIGLIEPYRFEPMFSSSSTDESDAQDTDSSLSDSDRPGTLLGNYFVKSLSCL